MATKEKVRVGVVGLGLWGQNHALVYDDYDRCDLVVVCDLDADRAKQYAERYRCDWTTNVAEVASRNVDAVSVATPDHTHFEPVRALLEAGKAVLVEKPLTTDLRQAKILAEIARRSGAIAMVDFQLRWDPQYILAKEMVADGQLGRLVMGYIRLSDAIQVAAEWLPWAGKSGPQWFLLPHTVDLMRWFIGEDPVSVYAVGSKGVLAARGVDCLDACQALVRFPSCFVTFETSWIVPNSSPSVLDCHMTLNGTTGKIDYDADYAGFAAATDRYSYPWVPLGKKDRYGKLSHHLYAPIRYFVDCVSEGKPTSCPLEDGVMTTAVIEAIMRSIQSESPQSIAGLLAEPIGDQS